MQVTILKTSKEIIRQAKSKSKNKRFIIKPNIGKEETILAFIVRMETLLVLIPTVKAF